MKNDSRNSYYIKVEQKKTNGIHFHSNSIASTFPTSENKRSFEKSTTPKNEVSKLSKTHKFNLRDDIEESSSLIEKNEGKSNELENWEIFKLKSPNSHFEIKKEKFFQSLRRSNDSPDIRIGFIDKIHNDMPVISKKSQSLPNVSEELKKIKSINLKNTVAQKVEHEYNFNLFKKVIKLKHHKLKQSNISKEYIDYLSKDIVEKFHAFRKTISKTSFPSTEEIMNFECFNPKAETALISPDYKEFLTKKDKNNKLLKFDSEISNLELRFDEANAELKEIKSKIASYRETYKYLSEKLGLLKIQVLHF